MKVLSKGLLKGFLLSCLTFQSLAAASNMTPSALSEVKSQIRKIGNASIIVEYESPILSKQNQETLGGNALKQHIDGARAKFMQTLQKSMLPAIKHEYDYVPGLVAVVNQDQLETLRNNRFVKNIYVNELRKTTLLESVDLVYPTKNRLKLDGGEGWTTAIIDTGVDSTHSFFTSNGTSRIISEACYSGGGIENDPRVATVCPGNAMRTTIQGSGRDCSGIQGCDHGTHVAGIAVGNGGIASGANVIAIQVFTGIRDVFQENICGNGSGQQCVLSFDSDIISGLDRVYALRNTFKIGAVNMSLGGGSFVSSCDNQNRLMTNAINRLKSVGIATTVSSGNSGTLDAISFPACISNAIAVGATADFTGVIGNAPVIKDQRVSFSSNGVMLDLYAPGALIRSSVPNNGFENFIGTSMAAPHVAGAFAVFRQAKPDATVAEIEALLKSNGPIITVSGVTRRRLDMVGVLKGLGVSVALPTAPIMLLLDDE